MRRELKAIWCVGSLVPSFKFTEHTTHQLTKTVEQNIPKVLVVEFKEGETAVAGTEAGEYVAGWEGAVLLPFGTLAHGRELNEPASHFKPFATWEIPEARKEARETKRFSAVDA